MRSHPLLRRLSSNGIRLGLDRVAAFLDHLGAPHRGYPILQIAGTNGKGSVTAFSEAIFRAQGLRVGATTSPHIQQVNERVRINGTPISDPDLDALVNEVYQRAKAWGELEGSSPLEGEPLTYFEAMVAVSFLHFSRQEVDVALVEVGLGGRLDATSAAAASVSAITSVGLDHCDRLGDNLASIAAEKAGIVRPGAPVVVGALPDEAMGVVRSMAVARESPMLCRGIGYEYGGNEGAMWWSHDGVRIDGLRPSLHGPHQLGNAAVALTAVAQLGRVHSSLRVTNEAMREGLSKAFHPGRLEWVADKVLVDGAHNVEAATALANYLSKAEVERPVTLLLGASADKSVRSIAAILAPWVDTIYTTHCSHPRAMRAGDVAAQLSGVTQRVVPAGEVEVALPAARESGNLVLVAGSLFLAGAVRELCGR